MTWKFDTNKPIYLQLVEQLKILLVADYYQSGAKLPSVRDLANEAGVNPNTLQRAFGELERAGLVFSQRTNGRFVTEDKEMIKNLRNELALSHIKIFWDNMKHLGFNKEEILVLLDQVALDNAIDDAIEEK
ncbi:MAG: GntR family transcriptional regulator [Clostridiales bacterium]